jgi:mannosyltransferase
MPSGTSVPAPRFAWADPLRLGCSPGRWPSWSSRGGSGSAPTGSTSRRPRPSCYLLVKPFGHPIGTEWLLRLPSALAAAVAVGVTTGFAARWLGRVVGVTAALLLVVIPVTSRYAQEARPNALAMLAVTGVVTTWWLASRDLSRRRWWGAFAVSLLLLALLNTLALTVLVGPFCAALVRPRARRALLVRTAAVSGLVMVLIGPLTYRVATVSTGVAHPLPFNRARAWEAVSTETGGGRLALCGLALAVVGLVVLVRRDPALGVLVGCWAFAMPIAMVVLSALGEPLLVPRYFVLGVPAAAVLVATATAALAARSSGRADRRRLVAGGLAAAVTLSVLAVGLPEQRRLREPDGHGEDVRPALALLQQPELASLPVVVYGRIWTLPVQAYAPQIVAGRMPTVRNPRPPTAIMASAVSSSQARERLARLDRVVLLVRHPPSATAPLPDGRLPAGLRGRDRVQTVTRYPGWWVDVLGCPGP